MVGHHGGLHGVLLLLARYERPPTAPARLGPAHLDLGGVQPQFDAFGLGVGEHVLHGAQTYPWPVRDRASALGQQRADLAHGPCDGGAVHSEQQAQHCVRQVVTQVDQGDHQPIDEDQAVSGTRPCGPFPRPAPGSVPVVLDCRCPGAGQLLDERGQVMLGDAGEPGMGQDRTIELDRHDQSMPRLFSGATRYHAPTR